MYLRFFFSTRPLSQIRPTNIPKFHNLQSLRYHPQYRLQDRPEVHGPRILVVYMDITAWK